MATRSESELMEAVGAELKELRRDWGWLLALGIGLIFGGIAVLTLPQVTGVVPLVIVTVLGILMIAAGAAQIVSAFTSGKWSGALLHLLVGILYAVIGFLVLESPENAAGGLTLLLAAMFFVEGIFRIAFALRERFPSWGWTLLNGAVSVLLGVIIWRQFPESTLWVIGLLVGIDMIFSGWAWIMLAIAVKQIPEQE